MKAEYLINVHRTKNLYTKVSEEDYENLSKFKWYTFNKPHGQYAYRFKKKEDGKKTSEEMQVTIMGSREGLEIDHIDRNGLNNQRENLRWVTSSQNKMNQKLRKDNFHGIKGISWCPHRAKWQAYIQVDKKRLPLGRFKTAKEALDVRLAAEQEHYGEHATSFDYTTALAELESKQMPVKEKVYKERKPQLNRTHNNTSGRVGIGQHKNGRWIARLANKHLGYFATFEEAVAAREAAERRYLANFDPTPVKMKGPNDPETRSV